jgi:small subunit ribosomal protein S15
MISKEKKQEVIKNFARANGDTGSVEVQVALLTARIKELSNHLIANPKDNHSRRGLLKLVSKRKNLLSYFEKTNLEACRALKNKLEIR